MKVMMEKIHTSIVNIEKKFLNQPINIYKCILNYIYIIKVYYITHIYYSYINNQVIMNVFESMFINNKISASKDINRTVALHRVIEKYFHNTKQVFCKTDPILINISIKTSSFQLTFSYL